MWSARKTAIASVRLAMLAPVASREDMADTIARDSSSASSSDRANGSAGFALGAGTSSMTSRPMAWLHVLYAPLSSACMTSTVLGDRPLPLLGASSMR